MVNSELGELRHFLPEQFGEQDFLTKFFQDKLLGDLIKRLMRMSPGETLPSERILAEELGISRTALRDRIGRLSSLGMLDKREREKTTFVGLKPDSIGDVLILGLMASDMTIGSLVSVRHALENQAILEIAKKSPNVDLDEMLEAVNMMKDNDKGEILLAADAKFHKALFVAAGSPGLSFFWQALQTVLQTTHQFVDLEQDISTMRQIHEEVYLTTKSGDQDAALRAMNVHFAWLDTLLVKRGYKLSAS
ncbi:MAG: FCD domain-containing protein [Microbacteriaceae bacterium]